MDLFRLNKNKRKDKSGAPCLVCGYMTIGTRGTHEICPVCFWEDEGEIANPNESTGGSNGSLSLAQARRNYGKYGAVERRFIKNVRPPKPEEVA